MTREQGLEWVKKLDHVRPSDLQRWLEYVGMSEEEFDRITDTFRNPRVWFIHDGQWWKENPWGGCSAYGEVIEHLFTPEALLHKCRDLLAERGLIFVSCPSYEGFDNLVLREASASIDHEHINLFNPDSLRTLFTRCGFRVEQILTPGELDAELVRKAALQHPGVLAGDPFLQYVLLDHWERLGRPFQDFLKAQCLSSHLWCVASNA